MSTRLLTEPDVYAAVIDFLKAYALPSVDKECIFRGWQNQSSLPAGSNEYIIVSVLGSYRRGTNVRKDVFVNDGDDDYVVLRELVEADVQIDFCSDDETAMRRAQTVEIVARDPIGVKFFDDCGIGCLYASELQEASFVGDDNNFVRRYIVTLRLSYWTGAGITEEAASAVEFKLESVDAHHKPKGD